MPAVRIVLTLAFLLSCASAVRAQDPHPKECPDSEGALSTGVATGGTGELLRIAEVVGRTEEADRLIRRGDRIVRTCGDVPFHVAAAPLISDRGIRAILLPVRSLALTNTGYARDLNDGALWAGRGLSLAIQGGVAARFGPFSAALAPQVLYHENADFKTVPLEYAGRSPLGYPHSRRIDWPQRPGERSFWTIDPGQSFLRMDAWGVKLGVSTENLWWGPGTRNALIMSSSAPGFPHLFAGTSDPADIWIGDVDVEAIWGRLSESAEFDTLSTNDHRLFTGIAGTFRPRFLPELLLGATRVFYVTLPPEGLPSYEYFRMFEGFFSAALRERYGGPDDGTDQLLSLFARWVLPESGFETYVEWGRTDRNANLDDFIQEPDHSQAYTLGFQKVVDRRDRWYRLGGELTHLEQSITQQDRGLGSWYLHSGPDGGYTHRGQLLGAWIGPSSSSQFITADMISSWGMIGLYGERVRHDTDAYYEQHSRWLEVGVHDRPITERYCQCGFWTHDVELTAGLRGVLLWRDFAITPELAYTHRRHRNFRDDDENWLFRLGGAWNPDVRLGPSKPAS